MIEFGSPGQRCGRGLSGQRRVWWATGTRCGEQCACGVTGLLPGTPVTSPARQHLREPWPGLAGARETAVPVGPSTRRPRRGGAVAGGLARPPALVTFRMERLSVTGRSGGPNPQAAPAAGADEGESGFCRGRPRGRCVTGA